MSQILSEFLDEKFIIITENADGRLYVIKANSLTDLLDDWHNKCEIVPANDDRVYFAAKYGEPINPYLYSDFQSLMRYLIDEYF